MEYLSPVSEETQTLKAIRLFALALCAFAPAIPLSAAPITSTYTFTGTCTVDCEGTGSATLVLADYTPGADLNLANFVSFTYISDYLGTWTPTVTSIEGIIPDSSSLPSSLSIRIYGQDFQYFFTGVEGDWCVGSRCASDAGVEGVWSAAAADVPEPSTVVLSLAGLAGLALLRRKR